VGGSGAARFAIADRLASVLDVLLQGVVEITGQGLAFATQQGLDLLRLSRAARRINRDKHDKALKVLGAIWRLDTLEEELRGPSLLCYAVAAHRAGRLAESEVALDKLLTYEIEDDHLSAEGSLLLAESLAIRREAPERAAAHLRKAAEAPHLETIRALLEVDLGTASLAELAPSRPSPPPPGPRGLRLFPGVALRERPSFAAARSSYLEGLLEQRRGEHLGPRHLMEAARKAAPRSVYARWAEEALAELPPAVSGPFR